MTPWIQDLMFKLSFHGSQTSNWLVVSTHVKNISQHGNLPQIGVKIKNLWNNHPAKGFFRYELMAHDEPSHPCFLKGLWGPKLAEHSDQLTQGNHLSPPGCAEFVKQWKPWGSPKKKEMWTPFVTLFVGGNTPNTDILFASWSSYTLPFCEKKHM